MLGAGLFPGLMAESTYFVQYHCPMSAAAAALIWWIVPALGLIGALGYAVWVSKFKTKYENNTLRSTASFKKFQDSFRNR